MLSFYIVNLLLKIDFIYINCIEIQFVFDIIYIVLSLGKVWDFDESDNFCIIFV